MVDLAGNTFSVQSPWMHEAKNAPTSGDGTFRIRCPDCGALLADYMKGIYLRRCWRCKGKALIICIPEMTVISMMSCIHDDQAYTVSCPHCGAPLGEFMIGIYRGICHYCKWGGIITRESISCVQCHSTLQQPQRDTVWRPGKPPGRP